MKQPETINSKSMIPSPVVLFREIRPIRGVKPWPTICISQNQIKYCLRPHQSWLTDPLSYRDSYGKTTLASNLWRVKRKPLQINLKLTWKTTNVLSSNSWHFINRRDLVMIRMVFLVCPHIRTWKRRSSIISGHLKIIRSSIVQWSVLVSHPGKWARLHMLSLEDTTLLRL